MTSVLPYDPHPYLHEGMHGILLRKEKRHRLVLGVRLIQQAAAVEIDINDVVIPDPAIMFGLTDGGNCSRQEGYRENTVRSERSEQSTHISRNWSKGEPAVIPSTVLEEGRWTVT